MCSEEGFPGFKMAEKEHVTNVTEKNFLLNFVIIEMYFPQHIDLLVIVWMKKHMKYEQFHGITITWFGFSLISNDGAWKADYETESGFVAIKHDLDLRLMCVIVVLLITGATHSWDRPFYIDKLLYKRGWLCWRRLLSNMSRSLCMLNVAW